MKKTIFRAFLLLVIFGFSDSYANADYAATVIYSCPSGGVLSGSVCNVGNLCRSALTSVSNRCTASLLGSCVDGIGTRWDFGAGYLAGYPCRARMTDRNNLTRFRNGTLIRASSYAATPAYSCPLGGTLSGTTCVTINGTCGSYANAGNTYVVFPPSPVDPSGFCAAGNRSILISGVGPWTWSCFGNGGTTASCSAQKTCTYFGQTCAFTNSVDCSNVANCGQANTSTAVCTAINSCTGSAENRPLIECGASCVTATSNCAACSAVRQGNWREVSR